MPIINEAPLPYGQGLVNTNPNGPGSLTPAANPMQNVAPPPAVAPMPTQQPPVTGPAPMMQPVGETIGAPKTGRIDAPGPRRPFWHRSHRQGGQGYTPPPQTAVLPMMQPITAGNMPQSGTIGVAPQIPPSALPNQAGQLPPPQKTVGGPGIINSANKG